MKLNFVFGAVIFLAATLTFAQSAGKESPNLENGEPASNFGTITESETNAVEMCGNCQASGQLSNTLMDCTTPKCPNHLNGKPSSTSGSSNEETR